MASVPVAPAMGGNAALNALDALPDLGTSGTDTAVAEATPETPAETADAGEPPEVDTPAEPAAEETAEPAAEEVAEPQAVETQPELDDDGVEIQPDKVSPDGKTHFFSKTKAERLMQSHHAWNSVQDAIPGASVEILKDHYRTAVAADEMMTDFHTGDPDSADRVLGFFGDENPHALGVMAMRLPGVLQRLNPEADRALSANYLQRSISQMYDEARSRGDEKLFKLAQNLDYKLTGKFVKAEDLQQRDAFAEREARIAERERALNDRVQGERRQFVEGWSRDTEAAVDSQIDEAITAGLEPVKKAFEGKREWKYMQRDLRESVESAIQANPEWRRQFEVLRQRDLAKPSNETREAIKSQMRQFADLIVKRHRKGVIEANTQAVVGQNASAHQKAKQAAAQREPAAAGAPVPVKTQSAAEMVRRGKFAAGSPEHWKALGW